MAREVRSVKAELKGAWTCPQLSWRPVLLPCSSDRFYGLIQNVLLVPWGGGGAGARLVRAREAYWGPWGPGRNS